MRKENSLSRRNFVAVLELSPTITACGPNAQELVDQQVGLKFAALDAGDVGAARAALTEAEKIRGLRFPRRRDKRSSRESASLAFLAAQDRRVQDDYLAACLCSARSVLSPFVNGNA